MQSVTTMALVVAGGSKRGRDVRVHDNFKYVFHKTLKSEGERWVCAFKNKHLCKAYIKICDHAVTLGNSEHTHQPSASSAEVEKLKIRAAVKRRVNDVVDDTPLAKRLEFDIDMEFMDSERSNQLVVYDGYKYRKQRELKDGTLSFPCSNKACKAYLKLSGSGDIVDGNTTHNHDRPDRHKLNRQMLNNALKRKAVEDVTIRPAQLMEREMRQNGQVALTTREKNLIRWNIHRARRKAHPDLSRSAQDTDNSIKREQSFAEQTVLEDPLASEESSSESGHTQSNTTPSDDAETTTFETTPFIKIENWPTILPDDVKKEPHTSEMFEPILEPITTPHAIHPTTIDPHTIPTRPIESSPVDPVQTTTVKVTATTTQPEQDQTSRKRPQNGTEYFEEELPSAVKTTADTSTTTQCTCTGIPTPAILTDPDAMFFLSQLPYVKPLSSTDRLDFRIKFMQLLQSYINKKP